MPINPPRRPTKQDEVKLVARLVEDWLDDHADLLAVFLMGGIFGYILGVN